MGIFGTDGFANDVALDWLLDINGSDALTQPLRVAAASKDYLLATPAQEAIAAAEIVAAMNGEPGCELPEEAVVWAKRAGAPPPSLLDLAERAVEHVKTNSELREMWEQEKDGEWVEVVTDLQRRLSK